MSHRSHSLVLAVYPNTRGMAFVLFEGPSPVDWGVKEARGARKNAASVSTVAGLLERYKPGTLVLQDTSPLGTRRNERIRDLNSAIAELAASYGVDTIAFSRPEVKDAFSKGGEPTKRTIALAVAKRIPEFGRYLPPVRKAWMSEHSRMALFEAAALGLTFFQSAAARAQEAA